MSFRMLGLLLLIGCSQPEQVPGWPVEVQHSPFDMEELGVELDCLAEDWAAHTRFSIEEIREATEPTMVYWHYDISGDQHLLFSNSHGRMKREEIWLAWADGDTVRTVSWDHEFAHRWLWGLTGRADGNHLGSGGPWDTTIELLADERTECSNDF